MKTTIISVGIPCEERHFSVTQLKNSAIIAALQDENGHFGPSFALGITGDLNDSEIQLEVMDTLMDV